MASIRQVAKEAGVSIATVSRVMNGVSSVDPNLRSQVLKAVESCDYSPGVGRRSLESIALLYVGPFTVGGPYDSACIDGMVEAMRDSKYDLTILDIHRDKSKQETLRQFFSRKGVRGAVIRSTADQRDFVLELAEECLPMVVLGDHFQSDKLSFVYADSKVASRDAVEHLVALGHKRIAFAACDREDGDHLDRLHSYRDVLDEHGLFDESLVSRVPPQRLDGAQLLRNLLGKPNRPTAIYIADPLVAIGAINEAHRMGISIPDDLSIVGFDDNDLRDMVHPRMSAVCQDSRLLGKMALEEVIRITSEPTGQHPKSEAQPAWLEIGNSSSPPPVEPGKILPTGTRLPG